MDNAQIKIREARVEDASTMITYLQEMITEPGIDLLFEPGEFQNSVEQEQEWIRAHAQANNSISLLAVAADAVGSNRDLEDGELVGLLSCSGGMWQAGKHSTRLGITVKKGWRDRGIGRMLMERAIEWARQSEVIKRVELEVFVRNARGKHLYESLGFKAEGIRRSAFKKGGEWVDSVMMGLLIE